MAIACWQGVCGGRWVWLLLRCEDKGRGGHGGERIGSKRLLQYPLAATPSPHPTCSRRPGHPHPPAQHNEHAHPPIYIANIHISVNSGVVRLGAASGDLGRRVSVLTPMGWGCQPSPRPRLLGPLQATAQPHEHVYPTNYLAKMCINIDSRVAWLGAGAGALGMRVNVLTPMGRGCMLSPRP